jgi:hypothetical protein
MFASFRDICAVLVEDAVSFDRIPGSLAEVVEELAEFLMPHVTVARKSADSHR